MGAVAGADVQVDDRLSRRIRIHELVERPDFGRVDVAIGDVVRLRKTHPCGGTDWTVVRLGADIGLKCTTCGRRILLPRSTLERRMKAFVSRARDTGASPKASQ